MRGVKKKKSDEYSNEKSMHVKKFQVYKKKKSQKKKKTIERELKKL
jgi:hypothetical protein